MAGAFRPEDVALPARETRLKKGPVGRAAAVVSRGAPFGAVRGSEAVLRVGPDVTATLLRGLAFFAAAAFLAVEGRDPLWVCAADRRVLTFFEAADFVAFFAPRTAFFFVAFFRATEVPDAERLAPFVVERFGVAFFLVREAFVPERLRVLLVLVAFFWLVVLDVRFAAFFFFFFFATRSVVIPLSPHRFSASSSPS